MKKPRSATLFPDIYTNVELLRRLKFKAKGFSFSPKQPINSLLSGKNISKLRGRGLNFEEMRQYHVGDDIRTMDWKVTLRTKKPHIKVFNEERERNVYLVVDQRQNMFFGSTGKMKSVIAAEIAALSAWQVVESTDRVGALIFNDEHVVNLPPKRSNQQVVQVIAEIVKQNQALESGSVSKSHHQSFNTVFEKLMRVVGHDALVILITDGRGWNDKTTEYIKGLRRHNELIICHVVDSLERNLPQLPQMILTDGAMQVELSTDEKNASKDFQQDIDSQLLKLTTISKKHKIPVLPFNTELETDIQLRKLLGR